MSGGDPRGAEQGGDGLAWLVPGCGQCRWASRAVGASEQEGTPPRGFALNIVNNKPR